MTKEEALSKVEGLLTNLFPIEDYNKVEEIVNALNKTGHWIDDEFGSKCSCCGIHTHLDKFDRPMKFKYCSMCGAKMDKEEVEAYPINENIIKGFEEFTKMMFK